MVIEVALALVLLTGAGLMMRTLQRITSVDAGFEPSRLLTMRFSLSGEQWIEARRQRFYTDLLTGVRSVPGVKNAALAFSLPIFIKWDDLEFGLRDGGPASKDSADAHAGQ